MIYPKITKGSFFILYSDKNTGQILNRDGSLYISKEQEYFDIFSSLNGAIKYAENKLTDFKDMEILIYNDSNEFIKMIYLDTE